MTPTLELANPWALVLLCAAPLLGWLFYLRRGRGPALRHPAALPLLRHRGSWARLWFVPPACFAAAIALCAVALARPRLRTSAAEDVSVEGIDIVIAFDISTSMLAADFQPKDRISVAKDVIDDFIKSRTNDRVGLVVFAGEAYTQCPLTLDYGILRQILKDVRCGVIEDGTAIGNALATSVNRLRESDAKSKVILLITDGGNNAGNIAPEQAAQIAKQYGIKVYTILVGKGGKVPYPVGKNLFGEPSYQMVDIDVNPELLKEIAKTTGGKMYVATDKASLQSSFRDVLDHLQKSKIIEGARFAQYKETYADWLMPGFLLAALGLLLQATALRPFP
ncbi:MAG: vWA domain-containing protein [Deltaproteobacteria bacterium]